MLNTDGARILLNDFLETIFSFSEGLGSLLDPGNIREGVQSPTADTANCNSTVYLFGGHGLIS